MSEGLLAVARLHHRAQDYPVNHHRAVAVLVLAEYPRKLGGGSVRPKRPGIYSQRGQRFPQLVRILYVVSELTFTVFCALVFYYSLGMLENMIRFKQVSAALEINVMYAYLIIPISMALTIFRTLQGLYRDIRNNTLEFESRED